MTWLLAFQIYLFSCIPAFVFTLYSIYDDVLCHMGKKKPDHKFGLNWQWEYPFNMCQIFIVAALVPVLNLYTGWYILFGVLVISIKERFEK